ncbi:MAG: SDR family oxidoreductase [Candidatus Bathyarchaeia archaeon]|jgi:NAD(P)-dependent dehydrogenase (short-subunit alcohol dehydrogenase family)
MKLQDKVAVITGGTDGIGKAIAVTFAKEGAKIMIVGRDEQKGQNALEEVMRFGEATYFKADVSDSAQVRKLVEDTIQRYGRIDVLINNAAVCPPGDVVTTSEETWDQVIDVNLKGVFLCCKYMIPHMQKTGGGAIVNIGSINSLMAMENEAAYDASKGGVLMLTRAIALDFAKARIRVNCICPGAIETPMLKASLDTSPDPKAARQSLTAKHPLRRTGTPDEVAQAALFLATDASSFVTGAVIPVDGGILAGWT